LAAAVFGCAAAGSFDIVKRWFVVLLDPTTQGRSNVPREFWFFDLTDQMPRRDGVAFVPAR
jgi:lipid-A-disaccharide synthase-like uncharacterized protein